MPPPPPGSLHMIRIGYDEDRGAGRRELVVS